MINTFKHLIYGGSQWQLWTWQFGLRSANVCRPWTSPARQANGAPPACAMRASTRRPARTRPIREHTHTHTQTKTQHLVNATRTTEASTSTSGTSLRFLSGWLCARRLLLVPDGSSYEAVWAEIKGSSSLGRARPDDLHHTPFCSLG